MTDCVRVECEAGVARVILSRPQVNNALNEALVDALASAFKTLAANDTISAVILMGEGKSLCSGADVDWMRRGGALSRDQSIEELMRLGQMIEALDRMPQTTIARVHGPIYGGGVGLVAACDIAIGVPEATFCFSEVRLGITPGMINPFVLRAIGKRNARRYFQSAEVFDAKEASRIGLLHEIVDANELDDRIGRLLKQLRAAAPGARAIAKTLPGVLADRPIDHVLLSEIAVLVADLRALPEAQEGLSAFLEKRKAPWVK
ncbi:methylglutaconyl-CoA hydratase [Bradyrhizobium sp. USDA 4503]